MKLIVENNFTLQQNHWWNVLIYITAMARYFENIHL